MRDIGGVDTTFRFIFFFQNAMDDQVRQVKAGRELCNLDRVPNPNIPIPANLRVPMPMMRPRFMPMMPVRGGPMPGVPGGLMMDPGMFTGPRMPVHSMAPMPMSMVRKREVGEEGGERERERERETESAFMYAFLYGYCI